MGISIIVTVSIIISIIVTILITISIIVTIVTKKGSEVDSCFSFNKPPKHEILLFFEMVMTQIWHQNFSFLASQSDAHRIAPQRDPNPTHRIPYPTQSNPLIALKQERPKM